MYNFKSASSSFEPPMFVVFPEFCEHTDTQYDYHSLPPTLRGEGNETLGQSSSQVNPVLIIDEQKTATKQKAKERSRIVESSRDRRNRKRWQPFPQPVDDAIKKLKVSIHNMFTLVNIIERC